MRHTKSVGLSILHSKEVAEASTVPRVRSSKTVVRGRGTEVFKSAEARKSCDTYLFLRSKHFIIVNTFHGSGNPHFRLNFPGGNFLSWPALCPTTEAFNLLARGSLSGSSPSRCLESSFSFHRENRTKSSARFEQKKCRVTTIHVFHHVWVTH